MIDDIFAAAEAATFTEAEIRALMRMAIDGAEAAFEAGNYFTLLGYLNDARTHANALIERRNGAKQ